MSIIILHYTSTCPSLVHPSTSHEHLPSYIHHTYLPRRLHAPPPPVYTYHSYITFSTVQSPCYPIHLGISLSIWFALCHLDFPGILFWFITVCCSVWLSSRFRYCARLPPPYGMLDGCTIEYNDSYEHILCFDLHVQMISWLLFTYF